MSLLWAEKYRPAKLAGIRGQNQAVSKIREWLERSRLGKPGKALLFYGPPGTGKTSAAYALANEIGYVLVEVNASELRGDEKLKAVEENITAPSLPDMRRRIVLIDEIDALPTREASKLVGLAGKLSARCPMVLTINDLYKNLPRRLRVELKRAAEFVEFKRLVWTTIRSVLKQISEEEGLEVDGPTLKALAVNSSGDLRAAINDLQAITQGSPSLAAKLGETIGRRDVERKIFDLLRSIFLSDDCGYSRVVRREVHEDPGFLLRWIEENVPLAYEDPRELGAAYDALSKADLYFKRATNVGNRRLISYSSELMTLGVCCSKKKRPTGWVRFRFPEVIRRRSARKELSGEQREIARAISKRLHVSSREVAREVFPILKGDMRGKGGIISSLSRQIGIEEDRIREAMASKKSR